MNKKILNCLLLIGFTLLILVIFLFLIKIENKQKNIIWKIQEHLILIDNNKKNLDNKKLIVKFQDQNLETEFKLLSVNEEINIYELNINYDFKNIKNEIEIILENITLFHYLFFKGGKDY